MSVVVREIREAELDECLGLWCTVFRGDTRAYFERYFYGDAFFEPKYTRVALVDGRIVSAVHIVKRLVACGECTFTMGGIANVATHPDARGQGLASQCLRQAVDVMRADGMDFSALGTGIPHFYARYGWERAYRFAGSGAIRAMANPPQKRFFVRPYRADDEEAIRAIYDEYNCTRPVTVRRSHSYWRDWLGWAGPRHPGTVLVAQNGEGVAAYCLYTLERTSVVVRELAARSLSEAAIEDLIWACVEAGRTAGADRAELRVPMEPIVQAAASRALDAWECSLRETFMVRLLNPGAMLRAIAPEINERWICAGRPEGALSFSTPEGVVTLAFGRKGVHVEEGGSGEGTQLDLLQLVTGFGPPRVTGPLAALFPERPGAWFWDLDGF
ncbi:MAG: GNAT family N-acetyltransferase [Chthonomonadales bacterium]